MEVRFYDTVEDSKLIFAVILARHEGKWVLCKHKERDTYEAPGGHREPGETIEQAARRELYEETGAVCYALEPLCIYSVTEEQGQETFGMLYAAEITEFEPELHSEIASIERFQDLPDNWTYPEIQPLLIKEYLRRKGGNAG